MAEEVLNKPEDSENNKDNSDGKYGLMGVNNMVKTGSFSGSGKKDDNNDNTIKEAMFSKWLSEFPEEIKMNEVYDIMHMLTELINIYNNKSLET